MTSVNSMPGSLLHKQVANFCLTLTSPGATVFLVQHNFFFHGFDCKFCNQGCVHCTVQFAGNLNQDRVGEPTFHNIQNIGCPLVSEMCEATGNSLGLCPVISVRLVITWSFSSMKSKCREEPVFCDNYLW